MRRPRDMSDLVESIPPLNEALTTIDHQLTIYGEAKRQYEALLRESRGGGRVRSSRASRKPVDVALYYRQIFETVTKRLPQDTVLKLMHICFAYKTKRGVLLFLDNFRDDDFGWVKDLKRVVRDFGEDSAFEYGITDHRNLGAGDEKLLSEASKQLQNIEDITPVHPVHNESTLATTGRSGGDRKTTKRQICFIIPTLPLAYPTEFFSALGAHAHGPRPSVTSLLHYPAMLRIAVNSSLKSIHLNTLPGYNKHFLEDKSWSSFFKHIFQGHGHLIKEDGKELKMADDDGYNQKELDSWISGWFSGRHGGGSRAKRKRQAEDEQQASSEKSKKIRSSANNEQGTDQSSAPQVTRNRKAKEKRVSFNGTPTIREIPIRRGRGVNRWRTGHG